MSDEKKPMPSNVGRARLWEMVQAAERERDDAKTWLALERAEFEKLRGQVASLREALEDVVDRKYSGSCLVKDEPCFDPACCSEGRFRVALADTEAAANGWVGPEVVAQAVEALERALRKLQLEPDSTGQTECMEAAMVRAALAALKGQP